MVKGAKARNPGNPLNPKPMTSPRNLKSVHEAGKGLL